MFFGMFFGMFFFKCPRSPNIAEAHRGPINRLNINSKHFLRSLPASRLIRKPVNYQMLPWKRQFPPFLLALYLGGLPPFHSLIPTHEFHTFLIQNLAKT